MKKIRIAILTRTTTLNFGTILQNYALQNYLKEKATTVQTVDDAIPRRIYSEKKEEKCPCGLKTIVANFLDRIRERRNNREAIRIGKKVRRFTKKNICYYHVTDFAKLNQDFDVFIAGSDQIWAYAAEPEFYRYFMLKEIADEKKKLAYAVSVGEPGSREEWIADAKRLLPRFHALSVREEASKKNISPYVEKAIDVVCDPVFLLGKEQWSALASKGYRTKGNYIFGYFLSDNEWYYEYVDQIAAELGYEVRLFQREKNSKKGSSYPQAGIESPEAFLSAIQNAKFVITDSYHCSIFSIIFQKHFAAMQRYSNENCTQNSRLTELLSRIGAEDRYFSRGTPLSMDRLSVEYSLEKLEKWVDFSKKFLYDNLV